MTADDGDNDAVGLFTDVALALDRTSPLAQGALDRLRAPGLSIHGLVARLLAAASARPDPIRLVIEDSHRLDDRRCLDALSDLISRH